MKQYITEIRNEHRKIDHEWLILHYKISIGLVFFSTLIECIMGYFVCNSEELHTSVFRFIIKFIVVPCVINLFLIFLDYMTIHSKKMDQNKKIYCVTVVFVMICMVMFTVHIAYPALYLIFVVAIMLTVVYASYKLTVITATFSILCAIISALFIKWDLDKVSVFSSVNKISDFLIAIFLLIGFSVVCMIVIYFEKRKNTASFEKELERYELEHKVKIDELTGIYNRNAFRNEIDKLEKEKMLTYFVMIDIDDFKVINDNFGHVLGDDCLIEFGKILLKDCGSALPFRFGGDEFSLIFYTESLQEVIETCKKIQKDISKIELFGGMNQITASFGIAKYHKNITISMLIMNADQALYQAKSTKNAIQIFKE